MTGPLAGMHLADHCAGSPTSLTQPLWLPDLPDICLLAYGCSSAAVVVQSAQASSVNATALSEQNVHIHNVAIPSTVLRMHPSAEPAEGVSSIAWSSQGVESKLAAVTGSTLAVFSLEHYISAIVQQTPLLQPHPGQSPACQAQHTCPLVALSWTQEGDGLLSADTQGCIIMWQTTSTTNEPQQLTQAWLGGNSTVVQPQSILAAGANILSPSASACPGTKHVTIWWPEELQQGDTEPAVPIPAAKDAGTQSMIAIAEQLRHPVGVVVAHWSPGSLQHGSSFTSSELDGSPLAATAQPALMTVGYDGMIRIWVEVTLSPSLGAQAPGSPSRLVGPSTPSSSGTPANQLRGHQLLGSSQFCLTLVVQPPNSTLIGFQPDSLRACWGVPCQGPLGPTNRMAAGSVLWILAMVDGAQQAKAADKREGSDRPSDQLLLWAVEGLAGVVINGIPNNVPGTRALNTPKAVLWGQHDALLTWPDSSTAPIAERQLACNVSLQDDSPVLHVVESCSMPDHSGITLRKYALHSVDDDASHTPSQPAGSATSTAPPRQLSLHDYTTQAITGHQSPITCLATHPSQPLIFTADQRGLTMLWHSAPLNPLGGLGSLLGDFHAAGSAPRVSAACWLVTQPGPKDVEGILAVATASHLVLLVVTMRPGKGGTAPAVALQHLGQAPLPTDYPCLGTLRILPHPSPIEPPSPGVPHPSAMSSHMSHHLLVGSLKKAPSGDQQQLQPQSRTQAQTHAQPDCIDAVALWQVKMPQRQGQTQQPSPQEGQPSLRLCHVFQHSAGGPTCVVAVHGAGFQLMLGDANGGVQLMSAHITEQEAQLVTVRSLPSAMISSGRVCDLALTDGGSHLAVVLCNHSGKGGCLQIWQSESAPSDSVYVVDAAVPLSEAPTAVAWLPSCAITPTVAVACSVSTLIFSQSHDQGWTVIAKLGNLGQPMGALQLDWKGLPIVTAGNQLGSVSGLVQAHAGSSSSGSPSQLLQIPLGQLALEIAGPLPEYAPASLALMIARGRIQAAREVIRHLLTWLALHDPSSHTSHSLLKPPSLQQQLLPDAPLNAVLDRPCLEALTSLVNALPLSNAPAGAQETSSALTEPQQPKHQAVTGASSTARHEQTTGSQAIKSASKQQKQAILKPSGDPFACDAGAFGMGSMAEEDEEERQPPSAQPDPFAFNPDAFGGEQEEDEAHPPPAQADKDPYAFDAGAFGMGNAQPEEGEGEEEAQNPGKPATAPADPFAFDPGAFGFSGEEQPQQPQQPTAQAGKSASATASAAASDPFAFNADAFGFNTVPEEEAEEAQPEVVPAEEAATAAAADPYAFDAGAFGMGVASEPDQASEEDIKPPKQVQGGQDPFAFDAGAFGLDISSTPTQQVDDPKPPNTKFQPAPTQPATAQASPNRTAAGPKAQLQSSSIQIHRPKRSSNASVQPAVLSSAELQSLQKLLGTALAQSATADSSEDPTSPTSPAGLTNRLTSALPPGLTAHSTRTLLSIAHMLCDDPPLPPPASSQQGGAAMLGSGSGMPVDWAALDEAAQKTTRAVQLAVCSLLSVSDGSSSADVITAPKSREVLDGLMAAPRDASQPQAGIPSKAPTAVFEKDGSWGCEMGVIRGLGTCALMWALLSESQDALLTQTINQLPVVDKEGGLAPPEFGFATSNPSAVRQAARGSNLTWEAMRHVGAGFWLTDQQVVVARAEALAKAQFAHRRDPHDCALMYLALKKKQLLMSLFRGANHKKQADFLIRDFSQDANKAAACKNAFTLLGQHRHDLAAAFFVLGGAYKDAVGVCAHELGDPQLALFLARLLEGSQSPLQQHLLSRELLPGAQEKQDSWAVCLLTWLQRQPAAALQKLLAQPQPDQATSSSDRSITPGQLNTNPPSTSGRSQTSVLPSSNQSPLASHSSLPHPDLNGKSDQAASAIQAGKHWDQALALDLLAFCLAPGSVTWPGQPPTLQQLSQLATGAAHGMEVTGHPVMALEALQIAQKCCTRHLADLSSHSDSEQNQSSALQQQQQILDHWQDRLVTSCLMRCLIDATQPEALPDPLLPPTAPLNPQDAQHLISQRWSLHRNKALSVAPLPNPTHWKKLAQQQLKILADAGICVDADQAMTRLQAMYNSLLANPHAEDNEAGGVEVGGTGLFRSISGISTLSTPRRNSTFSSGMMSSASGAVFDESHRLLHVDSDRLHAVCASNAGVYGYAGADGRPFAAASGRHGIVVGEVSMLALPGTASRHSEDGRHHHPASDSGSKGTTFSAMLGDMLEAVRWPQDPSSAPGSPFNRGSKGGKPESPSATRVRVPVGQIGTSTLAPHPTRQLFLTGCATGEIYLCQFGETKAKAGYTPMPAHLEAPAPSPQSLFTTPPKSWNPSPGVNFTHWGQPQAVCWSDDGERFAGLGDGGVVATWRLDAPRMAASDTGYLGRSDWCHQGLSKRGMDVTYLGSGSSVLAVAGQCSQGGNIVIWDTQRPLTSGPIARLSYHLAAVTALKVLPGSQLLASADEQGNIAVKDLRMLGGSSQQPRRAGTHKGLPPPTSSPSAAPGAGSSWGSYSGNAAARGLVWEVRGAHQGQGVVRMIAGLRPLSDGTTGGSMMVTGGRDGNINVWSCHRGRHLQAIEKAHPTNFHSSKGRNFFTDAFRSKSFGGPPAVVTGLALTADGLLSCGLDGNVKVHPFL